MLRIGENFRKLQFKPLRRLVTSASPAFQTSNLKIGDRLHGYVVNRIEDVPELCLTTFQLSHEKTGAQHFHLARNDSNNLFGVLFRTTPNDSTGVCHILEHMTLCGSQNFPCRDPFMKMLSRSLATFMNAFTGPDFTMYPFSSQNPRDFENLMNIYLDAVFFPRLRQLDFRQEGWRLEHQDVDDPKSPIVFKGVVFNEMKGVFSSPSSIFYRSLQNKMFPSNTYANESGGDPVNIPDLTHEQLKQFYARSYHPSNAKFVTYGNFPVESHLAFINDKFLSRFTFNNEVKQTSLVQPEEKWKKPKAFSIECQPDTLAPFQDKQTSVAVSYLLENITNVDEMFTLIILSILLTDGPNSPLYQALIDSGLGSDYSPGTGINGETKQSFFSVGLQGIRKEDAQVIVNLIQSTFIDVANEGFPDERIEATLHSIELSLKHQTSNFGLSLLMNLHPHLNHDGDAIKALKVNDQINEFRRRIKENKNYLKDKVKEYFVKNPHKMTLTMSPSDDYEENLKRKETEKLNEKLAKLNSDDKKIIYEEGLELAKEQQAVEDVSVLPTLDVNKDIAKNLDQTDIKFTEIEKVPIQFSPQPTNNVIYFHAIADLNRNNFPNHLIPYLTLFSKIITKLGAGKMNRQQLDQEILLRTGGLDVCVHGLNHPTNDSFEQGLLFSSYCLERNLEYMFSLWRDIFTDVHFKNNNDHILQLIRMTSAELSMYLPHHGHHYALTRAASGLNKTATFNEETAGISSLSNIRKEAAKEDASEIIEKLKNIASIAFKKNGLRIAVNAEEQNINKSLKEIEKFIRHIPSDDSSTSTTSDESVKPSFLNEHHVFPFANNYLGKAQNSVPFKHDDYPKLKIASRLVSYKYLLREVREKGGAYGVGAAVDDSGVFKFHSYRDPNVQATLDAFDKSIEWLSGDNYTEQDVNEAKLLTFQDVDAPIPPGKRGMEFFIKRISDQMKQEYRTKLLSVTKSDIAEATEKYLKTSKSSIAMLGPKNEAAENSKWKIIEEK